jgi:catechol 2,3-dioxygenase-like lactoylglutathione lyase family enzyme
MLQLDHLLVPARDRADAARRLARILDVPWGDAAVGPFSAVYASPDLTLDFDEVAGDVPLTHVAFRVDDAGFDRLVARLRAFGVPFRSTPHGAVDGRIGRHGGGRMVYWAEPDGHVWEALTVSYARRPAGG